MIDQWKDRVMILSTNGKLYKNRASSECIEFDHTVALFILFKLHGSNNTLSLFMQMSFIDLEEKYKTLVLSEREAELMQFFEDFLA